MSGMWDAAYNPHDNHPPPNYQWVTYGSLPENSGAKAAKSEDDTREWVTIELAARRLQVTERTVRERYLPVLRSMSKPQRKSGIGVERDLFVLEATEGYEYEYRVPDVPRGERGVYECSVHFGGGPVDDRLYDPYTGRPAKEFSEGEDRDSSEDYRLWHRRGYDPGHEPEGRRYVPELPLLVDWAALQRVYRSMRVAAELDRSQRRHSARGPGGRFTKPRKGLVTSEERS